MRATTLTEGQGARLPVADGIHFGARMEDAAQCMLVVIGATKNGDKESRAKKAATDLDGRD